MRASESESLLPRRRVNRSERLASQVRRQHNTELVHQLHTSSVPYSKESTRNDAEERTVSSQPLLLEDAVGADNSNWGLEHELTGDGAEPMQWAHADIQPTSQQNIRYAHNQEDEERLRAVERMRIRRAGDEHVRKERAANRNAMRI
ncbi:unnamed protein product [Gongylonema pulchrum]|uniref:Uncharacterized protein n=1 Tax=Gongylonema pulchrum TaxID=637853 RepID=A0A183DQJ5_9BILA|nr:unnamed protein product [Gongylonema pulchrum]